MPHTDFVHEIVMRVLRARLHAFLSDLRNHLDLHPLIVSIEDLAASPEHPGARRYRITDRIPLGPLRIRTTYTAAIEALSDSRIVGQAWQSPGIHLRTEYELTDLEAGTRLVERVSVEAPRLLRRFVVAQARRAHEQTLASMKDLLEAERA